MSKILNFGVLIFGLATMNAQVGINTTTPAAGAILEVLSDEKAILLPRLDITNLNSINPVTGGSPVSLLAYNANLTTGPGFYFWNGLVWTPIDNNRNWILRGNAGAVAPLNILGTIDNNAFNIRTNNIARMQYALNGSLLNYSTGSNSLPNYTWFNDADTGFYNSAANQFAYTFSGNQLFRFDENGRLKLGNNAQSAHEAISIDKGNGLASHLQFTVGTTTGSTATDGLQVGINNLNHLLINQYENISLFFDTNSVNRFQIFRIPASGNDLRKRKFNNSVNNLDSMSLDGSSAGGKSQGTGAIFSESTSSNNGSGYGSANINFSEISIKTALLAPSSFLYSFGLAGYHATDDEARRSGGVIGYYELANGTFRASGFLGYRPSGGSVYTAVYGSSAYSNGSGFSESSARTSNFGVIGYGGLVGQMSKGHVLGNLNAGQLAATYSKGNTFTTGKNIELVIAANGKVPMFTTTSVTSNYFENGIDQLQNGEREIFFDDATRLVIDSSNELPVITISALGQTNGLFIKAMSKKSFIVKEQNAGQSQAKFSWMLIAKNEIAENQVSKLFLDKDFDNNIRKVLISDNDLDAESKSTAGFWYDGQAIRFDKMPEHLARTIGNAKAKELE